MNGLGLIYNCIYVRFFFLCTDFGHFWPKRDAGFRIVFGPKKTISRFPQF